MRVLILALALLAALKIWVQDSFYRAATEEALVSAYRARAAESCRSAGSPSAAPAASATAPVATDWSTGPAPRIAIGNPAVDVRVWEFDSERWNARFRQPYLVLSAAGAGVSCTYDILADTAEITRS